MCGDRFEDYKKNIAKNNIFIKSWMILVVLIIQYYLFSKKNKSEHTLTFVFNKIPVRTKIPENWMTRREPNIAIGMNRSQDSIFNSNNSELSVVDKEILFSKITQIPNTIQNAKKATPVSTVTEICAGPGPIIPLTKPSSNINGLTVTSAQNRASRAP